MRLIYPKHHTINSIAKVYKVKAEWLNDYILEYSKCNQIEFHYSRYLKEREFFTIECAFGSPELIMGRIDPLIYNNNTKLAKLYRVDRKTFTKRINENDKIQKSIKQIYPYRYKYIPGEVALIIMELGLPDWMEIE